MAVYRSDQAQLTFATEGGHGGYPELASGISADGSKVARIAMTAGLPAGSRQVTVDNMGTPPASGDYIQIGPTVAADSVTTRESEVRRVEYVDGTTGLTLDAPTAFFHADNTNITAVTAVTAANKEKLITWVPGVYETVEVPDPEVAIEGRYLLGTNQKRNFFVAYKGQQTFAGSLGGFVLLNGWPLRYPIGKVTSNPVGGTITNRTYIKTSSKKGDIYINVNSETGLSVGTVIVLEHSTSSVSTDTSEIRRITALSGTGTNTYLTLNYPLQFDHTTAGSGTTQVKSFANDQTYYLHNIFETVDLDTISWNVHMRDSGETAANDFDRRYFGGHVGSMTLTADEGGLLTTSWDGINFQDMVHNQKFHSSYGSGSTALPGYALMQSIASTDIGVPAGDLTVTDYTAKGFPSTDPYYFSQGSLTMFGVDFARLRSFSLSIANNEEPRYYIGGQGKGTRRHRGPTEIRENNREYSMSASIVLPDSTAAATDTARKLFSELLLEGDYGTTTPSMSGFAVTLTFTRGSNDTITITIPDDGTAAAGGGEQGAFIRSAPHTISGDNPLQVEADILFRNMKIQIKDSEPFYP
jgi:hypothetical protein